MSVTRFCIAETRSAYWKAAGIRRGRGGAWALSLAARVLLAGWMAACLGASVSAQAADLRPEVMNAIRQAAEAASAPAPRYPVAPPAPPARAVPPAAAPPVSPAALPAAPPANVPAKPMPAAGVPRIEGRLQAADIGLVINTADPYSVAVGEHYIRRRGLKPSQVLRLALPTGTTLTRDEFEHLRGRIDLRFGRRVQALALAWTQPYAVECNSISGALALGFDAALCENSCKPSRPSRYFNASTTQPYTELGIRPSMLLAAPSVAAALALIDRGALSDSSLALRGRDPVSVLLLLNNADPARNVRSQLYPPAGPVPGMGVTLLVEPTLVLPAGKRMLMVSTGAARLDFPGPLDWVPGGLGDHLTSYGGALDPWHGQSTALEWIASGATASHGTVSEPCNHLQKFPHPQVLLLHYLQGSTALEAYWKSVAWPQQALFIGEPLAAPFAVPDWAKQAAPPTASPPSASPPSASPPSAPPPSAPPAAEPPPASAPAAPPAAPASATPPANVPDPVAPASSASAPGPAAPGSSSAAPGGGAVLQPRGAQSPGKG